MCSIETRAIEAYVAFAYILPSYIIYAISIGIVIGFKKTDFQGPFYTLLIINGIMELLDYPFNFLGRRATNIPEFFGFFQILPHKGLIISLWHGYIQYSVTIRYILAVFLSYIRFCIIVFPRRNDNFCLLHNKAIPLGKDFYIF
uniref:Uncharacterized protein n=1 Tax=Panagrolaimus davidi TaxID=227884 RepID=A0A914Q1Y9_9BILA